MILLVSPTDTILSKFIIFATTFNKVLSLTNRSGCVVVEKQLELTFQNEVIAHFLDRIQQDGPWDSWDLFKMAYAAEQSTLITDFNDMQCLKHLPLLQPLEHQINSAKQVLNEMQGRAILADEVGLGKTIEAGLILKEYMIRGLVKKALILVPSSLVLQWQRELIDKFSIPAIAQKKDYMWTTSDILIASIDTAKKSPHREIILEQEYDLLIVDEAHKLKNPSTKNYQFIKEIKKKYCLLLTATPVQNQLSELYNLITLLKPGLLGSESQFVDQFVVHKRESKNNRLLKTKLSKVMIRNRRSEAKLDLPNRHVLTIPVDLTPIEREFYDAVSHFCKDRYRQFGSRNALSLITLQREVCSSRDATYVSLQKMYQQNSGDALLQEQLEKLISIGNQMDTHSKALKTIELIKKINDKVIIFTEYRATMNFLQHMLHEHGITSIPFRGGFGRNKKDWMRELFEKKAQVLVATEAGGEGINLQFCNQIINYDLPWNPMKIEQRIGRVHRLGQNRDVFIHNLSTTNTIEEHILKLLYEKIDLFEMVIGELEDILEKLPKDVNLETNIIDIFLDSDTDREMEIKLSNMIGVFSSLRELATPTLIEQHP